MTLPYIDLLLNELARGNPIVARSFGRHIHWGYWPDPASAMSGSVDDFALAAERLSHELADLAGIAPGQRVLDAGCGFGGTIAALNDRIDGLDLVGLNIDPRQIARAAATVRPRPGNSIAFTAADACALPFADASFDRVMAVECIFHFPSRGAFLREVRRVLRPGGALVLSDFVPAAAFAPLCRLVTWAPLQRLNLFGACDVTCTAGGYRRLARDSGLELTTLRDVTRHTLPTYRFLRGLLSGGAGRGGAERLGGAVIGALDLVGRTGLLSYDLMRLDRK